MIISHIEDKGDGFMVATIIDADGNIVGWNEYGPDSWPKPEVGPVGEQSRLRTWWYNRKGNTSE